jgi:hypothetical protein
MKRLRILSTVFAVGLATICSGCAKINTAPFNQFKTGLESLREGADAQAAVDVENARARFVARAKSGKIEIPDLQLGFNAPFGYEYSFGDEPLYVTLTRFEQGMSALNGAMISYAQLLVTLAGDETIDPTRFDQLTKDLNGNATAAAKALKLNIPGNETALLSTAAVAIFRAIVERKRRRELTSAIREVQPQVVAYSNAMKTALAFLATGVTTDYDDQISPLIQPPGDVDGILKLNQNTVTTLKTLDALSASYGKLPEAHADLAKAATKRPGVLTGIIDFTNEALRLNALAKELAAANEAAAGATSP